MTFLDLLIYGLAAFRLSLMFSKESGPAFIFRKLRKLPPPKSSTKEGLSCQWCLSIYSASLVMTGRFYRENHPWIELWFIWPLAVSALAITINQTFTKGK